MGDREEIPKPLAEAMGRAGMPATYAELWEVYTDVRQRAERQTVALRAIKNMARYGWEDTDNIRVLFQEIGKLAEAALAADQPTSRPRWVGRWRDQFLLEDPERVVERAGREWKVGDTAWDTQWLRWEGDKEVPAPAAVWINGIDTRGGIWVQPYPLDFDAGDGAHSWGPVPAEKLEPRDAQP